MSGFITVLVNGTSIQMKFDDKVVRIKNDGNLGRLLDKNLRAALTVAEKAKAEYYKQKGKELNVRTKSMAIEILGHVYPGRLAAVLPHLPLNPAIQKILEMICARILKSTRVIDSGESSVDGNRWVWDALEVAFEALIRELSKNPILFPPVLLR